ncbi:MAG: metallophosphoesterase [Rhodospirillales bacterium]|nr:metallophosphoesterase [Rhodospirillales bacterium]
MTEAPAATAEQAAPAPRRLPPGLALRVVGDVHGDDAAFAYACATDRFIVQLGDLTDYGPDSAGVLRRMFALIDAGRGLFLRGNHDLKLARLLAGEAVHAGPALLATRAALDAALATRIRAEVARAPLWLRQDGRVFVHAGFHPQMAWSDAPAMPVGRPPPRGSEAGAAIARALFGEPTGRLQADGYPERSLRWIADIPAGLTVFCGHDRRSTDGRPWRRRNAAGGEAVFLDTGAGKGGHLSWIDL